MTFEKRKHYLVCPAPICQGCATDFLLWYPDEEICKKKPYSKWQKTQFKIAKLFRKGQIGADRFFTQKTLMEIERVRTGLKGRSPNSY